jgi:hypothetical protein
VKLCITHPNRLGRKAGRELIQKKIAEAALQYKLKVKTDWSELPSSSALSFSTSYKGASVSGKVGVFDQLFERRRRLDRNGGAAWS